MSAEYVRHHYGVDFRRGDRVTVDGRPGVVVSFPGQYVGVRLDGDKHTSHCHPTWRLEHMTGTDDRLARVLAGITAGRPVDDDPDIDYEPDGYSQAEIDRRGDEAADLDYDRRMR